MRELARRELTRLRAEAALRTSDASRSIASRLSLSEFAERYRDDFEGFLALLDIVTKEGERRPLLPLKSTQRSFLTTSTGRDLVLKARKVGMTTIACARDVWTFLTRPSAGVLVVCQSASDSSPLRDVSRILAVMLDSVERSVVLPWRRRSESEWLLEACAGYLRVVVAGASERAASKKGRAGTPKRLHVTEAAFYEYAEATLNAILNSMPGPEYGTEIVIESTPNGARGLFYEKWLGAKAGANGFAPHFHPWHAFGDNVIPPGDVGLDSFEPRSDRERAWLAAGTTPAQILWYRRQLASMEGKQDLMDQEHPSDDQTCWLVSGRSFFDQSRTAEMLARARPPIERRQFRGSGVAGSLRIYARPSRGRTYVLAADPSEGTGGDPSAFHVYERGTGALVAVFDGQARPWELAKIAAIVGREYDWAWVAVERNNHGHTVLRCLAEEQRYPRIFRDSDGKAGWLTGPATRSPALDVLEQAHRSGHWRSDDPGSLGDFRTFVVTGEGRAEAAPGSHDDHVMAAAIGWNVVCRPLAAQRSTGPLEAI